MDGYKNPQVLSKNPLYNMQPKQVGGHVRMFYEEDKAIR
jgi:hypothetical protein